MIHTVEKQSAVRTKGSFIIAKHIKVLAGSPPSWCYLSKLTCSYSSM